MSQDEFEPRLPKQRSQAKSRHTPFTQKVMKAVTRSRHLGTGKTRPRRYKFTGSRIGRGRAAGTLAVSRSFRPDGRRVVVRVRIAKFAGGQLASARSHLKYIQRQGVTREGERGQLYDAASDDIDGKAFLDKCKGDRHQFRLVVSPEDGHKLRDLKPFIRDLMSGMEYDLDTKLEWFAVNHFNTGYPHTHIVVRGKDDRGKNLILSRDYITHGIRHRAQELLTLELGPETQYELKAKLQQEISLGRFTQLDWAILDHAKDDVYSLASMSKLDPVHRSLHLRRLKTLEQMNLAKEASPGVWELSPNLEQTLRDLGKRTDIVKLMERDVLEAGQTRSPSDFQIHKSHESEVDIKGCVLAHGFADDFHDNRYVIIDSIDGYVHYANIGSLSETDMPRDGMIVHLLTRDTKPKQVDKTISDIAARNSGLYNRDAHAFFDETASSDFIETHVRRLEALRREGLVERFTNDTWEIGENYLEMARHYEEIRKERQPVNVRTLSHLPLEKLPHYDGSTWLDQEITSETPEPIRQAHFGAEVTKAIAERKRWLLTEGLATERQGQFQPQKDLVETLQRRELLGAGKALSQELKLNFTEVKLGEEIHGIYRRSIQLASGKYALIERAQDFTLVPWRSVLERSRGRTVSGIMRARGISWNITRQRGLGIG